MKRIEDNSSCLRLGPVKLYREEIERICDLLRGNGKSITISDDEFIYDSLDEMEERRGKRIYSIHIKGYEPYVHVSLGKERINRFLSSDKNTIYVNGEEGQGTYFQIHELLRRHINPLHYIFNWKVFWTLVVIELGSHFMSDARGATIHHFVVFIVLVYFVAWFYLSTSGLTYLSLEKRHIQRSFFIKNAGDIAKIGFGAILGAFAKFLFDYLSKSH